MNPFSQHMSRPYSPMTLARRALKKAAGCVALIGVLSPVFTANAATVVQTLSTSFNTYADLNTSITAYGNVLQFSKWDPSLGTLQGVTLNVSTHYLGYAYMNDASRANGRAVAADAEFAYQNFLGGPDGNGLYLHQNASFRGFDHTVFEYYGNYNVNTLYMSADFNDSFSFGNLALFEGSGTVAFGWSGGLGGYWNWFGYIAPTNQHMGSDLTLTYQYADPTSTTVDSNGVPEPSSGLLLAAGVFGMTRVRRRLQARRCSSPRKGADVERRTRHSRATLTITGRLAQSAFDDCCNRLGECGARKQQQ